MTDSESLLALSEVAPRIFENPADAARTGEESDDGVIRGNKEFATTDFAIALRLHNEEMARVNTSRALAENMCDVGLNP